MSTAFSNRIYELHDFLAQLPPAADDRVNQSLADAINGYCELRQAALGDLIDFMAKASVSNPGTQAKWQSRIARVRSDYNGLFGEAVKDLMLPPGDQLFWATALQAEERFFDTLSRIGTPQLMDDLLRHQDDLSKLIGGLADAWTFLLSQNQGIQNDEMRAVHDMDEMVQGVISELESTGRVVFDNVARAAGFMQRKGEELKAKIEETLGSAVVDTAIEVAKKMVADEIKPDGFPDDADGPMEAAFDQFKLTVQASAERVRLYRSLVANYRDLLNLQRGSVLTMFNKTRKDIDGYLSTNDVGKARVWLDQAKGQLGDWVSALPTSQQREDGARFRDAVNKQLDETWRITVDLDNRFRAQFQGAFLSPISNETVETLAQRYLFQEQLGKIKDRDAAGKLEEYRKQLPERLSSVEENSHSMDDAIDRLPDEVQALARSRNVDFQGYVRDRIQRQMELLLPAIDDLRQLLTPENLDADFDRRDLEEMLR